MNMFHKVVMWCPVITEFDNLVSKQTQETSRSYYEELLQVRLECKVKGFKVNLRVFNTVCSFLSA